MPIQGPRPRVRPGTIASATARFCVVGMLCAFQYWLLTATLESYHAGDHAIPLPAFIASVVCFLLAAGLVLTGEKAALKEMEYLNKQEPQAAPPPPPFKGDDA